MMVSLKFLYYFFLTKSKALTKHSCFLIFSFTKTLTTLFSSSSSSFELNLLAKVPISQFDLYSYN